MRVITVGTRAGSEHERWLAALPQASVVARVPSQATGAHEANPSGRRTGSAEADPADSADLADLAGLADPAVIREGAADIIVLDPRAPLPEDVLEAVFASGAPVVVEVPVGLSADGAEHLDRTATRLGANTVVPFRWRENPALRDVRAALAGGVFGVMLAVEFTFLTEASAPMCVGALVDPGLHVFDLLPWLTDQPSWRVEHAWAWPAVQGRLDDEGVERDEGTLAQVALAPADSLSPGRARIQAGRLVAGECRLEVSVLGTAGSARVRADPADGSAVLVQKTGSRELRRSYPANAMNPYRGLAAGPVVAGFTGRATVADAARALRLTEAAAKAAGQAYGP